MPLKVLIIRRDNIGDLVCTTPAFAAIRQQIPDGRLCALVNSYNAEVLRDNPFIDRLYVYKKAKHRGSATAISVLAQRIRLVWALRRERFDVAILAGTQFSRHAWKTARLAAPREIVGYASAPPAKKGVWRDPPSDTLHEVEAVFGLLTAIGIKGPPPALTLAANAAAVGAMRSRLDTNGIGTQPIAIHISARKPSNRWPVAHFIALIKRIHAAFGRDFILLWSPGDADNKAHPGDDDKAAHILSQCHGVPIAPVKTETLQQLIAALSLCDVMVCGDGGAMHLAAALQKRTLCFFGESNAMRWHPWGVPYILLQKPSRSAADIDVDEAFDAFTALTCTDARHAHNK